MTRFSKSAAATLLALVSGTLVALAGNIESGTADAWFNNQIFTVSLKSDPTEPIDERRIHQIYTSRNTIPGVGPFVPVLGTLPGEGPEDVWVEIDVDFLPNILPRQLTSESAILEAQSKREIVLTATENRFQMTLIGAKDDSDQPFRLVRGDMLKPISAVSEAAMTWGQLKLELSIPR
ncbi:MAG: hypothetical protein SGI90_06680 [Candidatus Eisenbacteria bacterium]|nr:hypothetical protein [Candidatus Eisenbacteria bacterium]